MHHFDWIEFFEQHNISYRTHGQNCGRGEAVVQCPFCGDDDPSEHMGVSLERKVWNCWRHPKHCGSNPVGLVQALLKCSWNRAYEVVGSAQRRVSSDFLADVKSKLQGLEGKPQTTPLIRDLTKYLEEHTSPAGRNPLNRHFEYLVLDRAYTTIEAAAFCLWYNLRFQVLGDWKERIIIPIYWEGDLVGWTARSIRQDAKLRYKTLNVAQGAKINVKNVLFMRPDVVVGERREVLIIVEGPFDAMHLDWLIQNSGKGEATVVGLFGVNYTLNQLWEIKMLARNHNQVWVMFDRGAENVALDLCMKLSGIRCKIVKLPPNVKDPSELSYSDVAGLSLL